MTRHLPLVALLAFSLAGCIQTTQSTETSDSSRDVCVDVQVHPCVPGVSAPKVDARKTLDDLKSFSQAYPYRQSGSPTHLAARDDLAKRFKDAGLDVVRESFPSGATGGALKYNGENIIGVKWGSDRSHFIVIGAHYDVTEGAVYGTYDDGSGTALVFELANAFAKVPTNRTILFIEFDQEELGLVGSKAFVNAIDNGSLPINGTVDGMVDLDMIGITWPHPAHIIVWQDSPSLRTHIMNLTAAAGVPADHLEFRKTKGGSSDGATFITAKIPTAYFWSDWDQYHLPDGSPMPYVGLYVGAYPWWHKVDTYDTMVAAAGSEATLQKGFQTTLDIISPLLLDMTRTGFTLDLDA